MPAHSPPPRPPSVPGYRLTRLLGRGGSGEVWEAVPRTGGAPVAVKLLVAGDAARQATEAELLGGLDHPHLVRLIEVVHLPRRGERSEVALVLELLAGGSLAALLARRGRLRPGEVVTAIAPVAAALAHAHAAGIVHGDLSPGNIVFTGEGRPVLTDLGVARLLGAPASGGAARDEVAPGEVTPAYVDPTVARGGAAGPASDVFGVAAAAFHALTGIAPWNAATPADTVTVAAAGELPDLDLLAPEAPAQLRAVIARGLAAEPHLRGTAAAFALDLRHSCRPEPVRLSGGDEGDGAAHDPEGDGAGRRARAELTHQVAGRRSRAAALGDPPARPGRARGVPRRRVMSAAAVLLAVLGVAAAVWFGIAGAAAPDSDRTATAGTERAAPPASPEPQLQPEAPASPGEWRALLQALYAQRAAAFATTDSSALDTVYADGSAPLAADRAAVNGLATAGEVVADFRPEVVSVEVVTEEPDRIRLQVVDRVPAYRVVPAAEPAALGRPVAARAESAVTVDLVSTPEGWRILAGQRAT